MIFLHPSQPIFTCGTTCKLSSFGSRLVVVENLEASSHLSDRTVPKAREREREIRGAAIRYSVTATGTVMGVWREGNGWCFCGGGRTERLMGSLLSCKGPAMASISSGAGRGDGTGFLIHPNLLLTTHGTLASVAAAEDVEIQLNQGRFPARLVPYRSVCYSNLYFLNYVSIMASSVTFAFMANDNGSV